MRHCHVQRSFIPGSEWLYFKIYAGSYIADEILKNEVNTIIKKLYKEKIIDYWFFIRFIDTGHHIRLRFHLVNIDKLEVVLELIYGKFNKLNRNRVIYRIDVSTYEREIERYGKNNIVIAEQLFCVDSSCIINLLKQFSDDYVRGIAAFKIEDTILSVFGLNLDEKRDFEVVLADSFKREFEMDYSKVFNQEYRKYQKIIRDIVEDNIKDKMLLLMCDQIEKYYNNDNVKKLLGELHFDREFISKVDFLRSYVHMSFNRLFNGDNRKHEMVIHEYMARYYKGAIARMLYSKSGLL